MIKKIVVHVLVLIMGLIPLSVFAHPLSGYLVLQAQQNGEAWYINQGTNDAYYLGRPEDAWCIMAALGLGATDAHLAMIPKELENFTAPQHLLDRVKGRILLQTEQNGEAWYVHPQNGKRYYLGTPSSALQTMRKISRGVTRNDILSLNEKSTINLKKSVNHPMCNSKKRDTENKAVWVWDETVTQYPEKWNEFHTFAEQKNITRAFVFVGKDKIEKPSEFNNFLYQTTLETQITLDNYEWAYPENHAQAHQMVDSILGFYNSHGKPTQLKGIHSDIEPHVLMNWEHDRTQISLNYLKIHKEISEKAHQNGLELSVAMPVWWNTFEITFEGKTKKFSEHVIDIVDEVVMMDYRDFAIGELGLIESIEPEASYAKKAEKKITLGVETQNLPHESEWITFYEEGENEMYLQTLIAREKFRGNSAFNGTAIHFYNSYKQLKK